MLHGVVNFWILEDPYCFVLFKVCYCTGVPVRHGEN